MTVTRIEELSRSRCKIYLEDSFAFVLYKGELRLYGVREQEELSEESYREIMQEVLPKRATLRCMNLLQSRPYTESKLRSKLKEGGYPQESVDSALAYVKSYHYVDDLQFAKDYIVNQAGKKSKRVLEQDLIARGVSRDEIEAAFAEAAEKGGFEHFMMRWTGRTCARADVACQKALRSCAGRLCREAEGGGFSVSQGHQRGNRQKSHGAGG